MPEINDITNSNEQTPRGESAFGKAMKRIFVHNIKYKILAIVLSFAAWIIFKTF